MDDKRIRKKSLIDSLLTISDFFPIFTSFCVCPTEIFHMLEIISHFTFFFFFYLIWRNVYTVIKNLGKHFKITA